MKRNANKRRENIGPILVLALVGAASSAAFGAGGKTPVPADCGLYLGSGVYGNAGKMYHGGFCSTYWSPEKLTTEEQVDLCLKEGVGNTLQFWQKNDRLVALAERAKAKEWVGTVPV